MSKTLVTYFSASGVTARKGQKIAQREGADTFEIKPAVPYTSADLNWQNSQSRSSVEVYVGFPIWGYTAPNIIYTFVDANREGLKGKQIVLFMTSGGSGIAKSVKDLQNTYPELDFKAE